jgi:hypothetical protein
MSRLLRTVATALATGAWLAGCSADRVPRPIECDLGRGPCAADTGLGRVALEISPRPIATMTPLNVVMDASEPLDDVALDLNGRDMEMGPNTVRLTAHSARRWQGSATIPVCLTGRMRWNATIILRRGARTERLSFEFESG